VPKQVIEYVEKIVEVPQAIYEERPVEVPEIHETCAVTEVPKPQVQSLPKYVPKVEFVVEERIQEVPMALQREEAVEVPTPLIVEPVRQVLKPEVEYIDREIPVVHTYLNETLEEVPQILYEEQIVEVPQIEQVELIKEVPVQNIQHIPREIPVIENRVVETIVPILQEVDIDRMDFQGSTDWADQPSITTVPSPTMQTRSPRLVDSHNSGAQTPRLFVAEQRRNPGLFGPGSDASQGCTWSSMETSRAPTAWSSMETSRAPTGARKSVRELRSLFEEGGSRLEAEFNTSLRPKPTKVARPARSIHSSRNRRPCHPMLEAAFRRDEAAFRRDNS
jgi:hypothetical protein